MRPSVAVVIPFRGPDADARALAEASSGLALRDGDSITIVDNRTEEGRWPELAAGIAVVPAPLVASSYYARNAGAARTGGDWILFLDADCRPPPSLLDDYLTEPVAENVGLLAGEVGGVVGEDRLVARWLVAREHLAVAPQLARSSPPHVGTANLMVRRSAWEELGGFAEVRSGADYELCARAAAAGWELEYRPGAGVAHVHDGGLGAAIRRARRYGAGQAWLNAQHPGSADRPHPARQLGRAAAGSAWWTLTGRFERGAFKAIDGVWAAAFAWGWHRDSNAPGR